MEEAEVDQIHPSIELVWYSALNRGPQSPAQTPDSSGRATSGGLYEAFS